MNLVIIGGKGANKIGDIINKNIGDIEVSTYNNTDIFLKEATMRSFGIHRVILMQDGIDNLPDESVYNFTDFLTNYYPSARIITISKDAEIVKFLGDLITTPYSVHFLTEKMYGKMVTDLAASEIEKLKKSYSNIIYAKKTNSFTDIVEETENKNINAKKGKRGFLRKVFGIGPKKTPKTKQQNENLKSIGHGIGVEEFEKEEENAFDEETAHEDFEPDFDMFDSEENDIGLGADNIQSNSNDEKEDDYEDDDYEDDDYEDDDYEDDDYEDDDYEDEEDTEDTEKDVLKNVNTKINFETEEINNETEEETLEDWEEEFDDFFEESDNDDNDIENTEEETKNKQREKLKELAKKALDEEIHIPNFNKISNEASTEEMEEMIDVIEENSKISGVDLEGLMEKYQKKNTKIVEKVVTVTKGGQNTYRNKNGIRLIIITGDRRIGSTKLAMNLAHIYSKKEKTLLVDYDRYRKGVLSYVGVEHVIDLETHKQNGIKHLKKENMLNHVTYIYPGSDFEILSSMYGEEIEDEQLINSQKILYNQKDFKTVVIDCPLENLYLLEDLIYASNILYCIEDNKVGVINSVLSLNSCVEDRLLAPLFNNINFIVGRRSNISEFHKAMSEVSNMFGLDETTTDWKKIKVLGTINGTKEIAMVMEDE